jgi:hypothetical protein
MAFFILPTTKTSESYKFKREVWRKSDSLQTWPARCPDLNPYSFYLLGNIRNPMYLNIFPHIMNWCTVVWNNYMKVNSVYKFQKLVVYLRAQRRLPKHLLCWWALLKNLFTLRNIHLCSSFLHTNNEPRLSFPEVDG